MSNHTSRPAAGLLVLLTLALHAPALAQAPRVVNTTPTNEQQNVDPGLTEIRVRFDKPMDRSGFSVVGGGPLFPKIPGRVKWADDHTLSIPVRLEPSHHYELSINSETFDNCRGTNGLPAIPFPLTFDTRDGPASRRADTPDALAARNRDAVNLLKTAIDEDYSYRDLRHVDWPAQFAKYRHELENASTPAQFAETAARLLEPSADLHVSVHVGDRAFYAFKGPIPDANFNMKLLPRLVPDWTEHGKLVATGQFPGGPSYILIRLWDPDREPDLQAAYDLIAKSDPDKGLIIDVRPNGGGAEPMAQRFAGCFVDEPRVYGKNDIRSGGTFHGPYDRVLEPNPKGPHYRGKTAVLTGPRCVSSNESFLLMMRTAAQCKLIGQRSRGASGNPKPVELPNDVTVYLSSWRDMLPDGICFEGVGIIPDIEVRTTPKDFADRDPVLDTAVKQVSARN
jgi:hypothetical protein